MFLFDLERFLEFPFVTTAVLLSVVFYPHTMSSLPQFAGRSFLLQVSLPANLLLQCYFSSRSTALYFQCPLSVSSLVSSIIILFLFLCFFPRVLSFRSQFLKLVSFQSFSAHKCCPIIPRQRSNLEHHARSVLPGDCWSLLSTISGRYRARYSCINVVTCHSAMQDRSRMIDRTTIA